MLQVNVEKVSKWTCNQKKVIMKTKLQLGILNTLDKFCQVGMEWLIFEKPKLWFQIWDYLTCEKTCDSDLNCNFL